MASNPQHAVQHGWAGSHGGVQRSNFNDVLSNTIYYVGQIVADQPC